MKKDDFKFELGQKVFWLGHQGMCNIRSRGRQKSINGADFNIYLTQGAHCQYLAESELLTLQELMQVEQWREDQ